MAAPAPFLRGSFESYSLAEVFAVLALSRQYYDLRLSDNDGEVGAIAVKAGQVIGAEHFRRRTEGADALDALLGDPGTAFAVALLPQDALQRSVEAPIGKLSELVPGTGNGERGAGPAPAPEADGDGSAGAAAESAPDANGEAQTPEPVDAPDAGTESDPPPAAVPEGAPPDADDPILHGTVSDASFEEILEVLQLSDQPVTVAFIGGSGVAGTLTLRAEQVLEAAAGSLRGAEAFERLYADHGERFEVRRAAPGVPGDGLGAVAELLAGIHRSARAAPSGTMAEPRHGRSLFMRGRLSDFPLDLLVGSLHLSRQPIQLEFRRQETVLHRVHLKAGMIVGAESASAEDAAGAMAAIRRDPGDEFFVYRCKAPVDGPAVASLADLVSDTDLPDNPLLEGPAPGSPDGGPDRIVAESSANPAAEILAGVEEIRERTIAEIQAALAASGRGRRERVLLWSILGLQTACLAIVLGVIVLAQL